MYRQVISINLFPFLPLLSCVILFFVGIVVFSRNWKSPLHRTFLLMCGAASYWAFAEFMLHESESFATAYVWLKLTAFWTFVPALLLHFILIFTRTDLRKKRLLIYSLIYAPAAIFCGIELTTSMITSAPILQYWGYTYGYPQNSWFYFIELAWAFGMAFIAMILCVRFYFTTTGKQEKKQAQYVLIGFGIPSIVGIVTQGILPILQINLPEMTTIFLLLLAAAVGYAVWKYELFTVSPATAAENILSTMSDSLLLLDTGYTVLVMNKATRDMLGYGDELIGRPVRTLFCEESDADKIFDIVTRKGQVSDYETTYCRKDGKEIPVSFSGSVIRDNDGDIAGIVCVARDIAERRAAQEDLLRNKEELHAAYEEIMATEEELRQNYDELLKTEQDLRESEKKFRNFVEFLPQTVFETDEHGTIISANPVAFKSFGYSREDLKNRITAFSLVHPVDRERARENMREIMRGKNLGGVEYTALRKDGTTFPMIIYSDALIRDGKPAGMTGVLVDITERRKVEDALNRATRKLNLLNFITLSDIQSAVFSLSGYLELAKQPITAEKMKDIQEKQAAIVHQIETWIRFAKNYQGLGLHPPIWQNANRVFLFAISHLDLSCLSRKVSLDGLEIYADPLLENVFYSLAENVILHGKTATGITLSCRETGEGLTIIFEDDGIGIPADLKETIFERRFEKKNGMGLFLAREILEITGITIRETGEPGRGARFEMTVPKGSYRFSSGPCLWFHPIPSFPEHFLSHFLPQDLGFPSIILFCRSSEGRTRARLLNSWCDILLW